MTSKAGLIIAELQASIISLTPYNVGMLHYFPSTSDIVNIDATDLPQLWIYCDSPRVTEQTTAVTESTLDIQIVHYYRHANNVTQDSLAAMQLEQDYMANLRSIVYVLQERQRTVSGVPDLWVSADAVQVQGRINTLTTPGELNPVYNVSMDFTISFEEEY